MKKNFKIKKKYNVKELVKSTLQKRKKLNELNTKKKTHMLLYVFTEEKPTELN